jgi:hypothetical protein
MLLKLGLTIIPIAVFDSQFLKQMAKFMAVCYSTESFFYRVEFWSMVFMIENVGFRTPRS